LHLAFKAMVKGAVYGQGAVAIIDCLCGPGGSGNTTHTTQEAIVVQPIESLFQVQSWVPTIDVPLFVQPIESELNPQSWVPNSGLRCPTAVQSIESEINLQSWVPTAGNGKGTTY